MNRSLEKARLWRQRSKGLRPVSPKRARVNRERGKLTAAMRRAGPVMCRVCGQRADDLHELLSRARGGSITSAENTIPVCRPCHRRITESPAWAEANGWSRKGVRHD